MWGLALSIKPSEWRFGACDAIEDDGRTPLGDGIRRGPLWQPLTTTALRPGSLKRSSSALFVLLAN